MLNSIGTLKVRILLVAIANKTDTQSWGQGY